MNEQANLSGKYGSKYISTTTTTVEGRFHAFQAFKDTTFGTFTGTDGNTITDHDWAGKTLPAGYTAWFGEEVITFTLTAGGEGQAYKCAK